MIKVNNCNIEISTFPNGEKKISDFRVWSNNKIDLKWEGSEDLINLLMIKGHIDSKNGYTDLHIAYMPFSRMDRKIDGSVFTLKYVCDFINSLSFRTVTVYSPHSDVTPALLDRCETVEIIWDVMNKFDEYDDLDYVFYPDTGAAKRYTVNGLSSLVGFKKRNLDTGRIEEYDVFGEITDGCNIAILDDLSSYGNTFRLAAKQLKKMGADNIYLFVAHCENSILDGDIFKENDISKVFTTNSIIDKSCETDRLIILDMF